MLVFFTNKTIKPKPKRKKIAKIGFLIGNEHQQVQ